MTELIHPELSYQVRGILFDVYNTLGPMLKEVYYQNAILLGLKKRGIKCQAEKAFEVYYEGERVGLYYIDTWIEDGKILLELKVAPAIEPLHQAQAISYLKVSDADLAVVVNYGASSLEDRRFPNLLRGCPHPVFTWHSGSSDEGLLYPEVTEAILCACHRVHFVLGPGFLHQVYRRATMIELRRGGLNYDYIKQVPIEYQGELLGYEDVRLIKVEDKVLVTAFALRQADETLSQQLKIRLRQQGLKLGLLVNFYGVRPAITPVRILVSVLNYSQK